MHKLELSLVVLGAAVLVSIGDSFACPAKQTYDGPASIQQVNTDDHKDKVYQEDEVDKKAQLRNQDKFLKDFTREFKCDDNGGKLGFRLLLHKSGKVTDVKIDISPHCNFSEKGRTVLRRLKFSPAIKNGVKVSEYLEIEIKRELVSSPGPR
jgi:hypothetical protein